MAAAFHCPNPECPHLFAPGTLTENATTRCPRCGQAFRFRPPKPKAAPVAKPAGPRPSEAPATGIPVKPPPGLPGWLAQVPDRPKPALVEPLPEPPPTPETNAPAPMAPPTPVRPAAPIGEALVRVRDHGQVRSRHPVLKAAVVLCTVAIFVAGVLYAIWLVEPTLIFNRPTNGGAAAAGLTFHLRNTQGVDEKVLAVDVDRSVWPADKELKAKLQSLVAFRHEPEGLDAWFAVAVQDFGQRKPREGEMMNAAFDRLRRLFGDTFQYSKDVEPATLLELDATRFEYRGTYSSVRWEGECYLVAHQGVAFWFFFGAPTRDEAQQVKSHLEANAALAIVTERRGWREQPPETDLFASRTSAFLVQTPKKVWDKFDPLTMDENGEIYLRGLFVRELDNTKNANLLAIALERRGDLRDCYKAAVAYLEKKKKEESPQYELRPLTDPSALRGELLDVGDQPGCIGELELRRAGESMRYVLLGVFRTDAKTYALRFECATAHRPIWRQDFLDILKTVRLEK